ncbi:MAG TPA: energy-coupling factor transporter transmembrane component T [Gaiellaceae bacterium]|nr:energy-coupling factor transporter transmembrane component T [Gaiellaceae bacterium]
MPRPGRGPLALGPVPGSLALGGTGVAALLLDRPEAIGAACALLLAVVLRAPPSRRRPYLVGALGAGASVLVLSPFLASEGFRVLWAGPVVPVLGALDVTREELVIAAVNGGRLTAVALAFSAYALLVDHDRLLGALGFARRSALTAVLATRLVPTLERDAAALREAVRGRGVSVRGLRGHARLVSPLVAGSLERALNLAEAMEARGFGRAGRTRLPQPPWSRLDAAAVVGALVFLVGAVWL